MFKFITNRPLWVNLVAGFLLMVLCLFLLYLLLGPLTRHGKNRIVPSVTGKSFEEAVRILSKEGFDVEIQDSIFSDTAARGVVIRQVPDGDAVVKISRTVYLTINRHVPPEVEMPNLIGYSFRNAELQLKNMGLNIGDTTFRPDFAKNSVLEQWYNGTQISPGTKIRQGSTISLVLGDGVGTVEFAVPNIIGKTYAEAKLLLEMNGLSMGAVIAPGVTDTMQAYIIQQKPTRFDDNGKLLKIRPGQMMDVFLSTEKPVIDSLPLNEPGL